MPARSATVAVVGLGYIGLPTAVVLARAGLRVTGVDLNPGTVELVSQGNAPFAEPDLAAALSDAVARGNLTTQGQMPAAGAFMIAVPTPVTNGRRPDLRHVVAAAEAIAPVLRGGEIVIVESTVPPGTTWRVSELIAGLRPDLRLPHAHPDAPDVHVAHCPERVLPGRIMTEIVANDRIIGGITPACAAGAAKLYQAFCTGQLIETDATSAELAKLAENTYRDVNIAFANELSLVCDRLGLDVWRIRELANHHPRVDILRPGPGVGGHCIAVDPWFIVDTAPDLARLTSLARAVNDDMPALVARRIVTAARRLIEQGLAEPVVACLGLSFKADIDDLRGSPAIEITGRVAAGLPRARVLVADPHVTSLPAQLSAHANIEFTTAAAAIPPSHLVALLVDHRAFGEITTGQLEGKLVIDTRGRWAQPAG